MACRTCCPPPSGNSKSGTSQLPHYMRIQPIQNPEVQQFGSPCKPHTHTCRANKEEILALRGSCQQWQFNHHHHYYHYLEPWEPCCRLPPFTSSPSQPSRSCTEEYPSYFKCRDNTSSECRCTMHTVHLEHTKNTKRVGPCMYSSKGATRRHSQTTNNIKFSADPTLPSKAPRKNCASEPGIFPPLPSASSPPYVLCQHCFRLLILPVHALDRSIGSSIFKLKCSVCMRVSFFSTCRQRVSGAQASELNANLTKGELHTEIMREKAVKNMDEEGRSILSVKDSVSQKEASLEMPDTLSTSISDTVIKQEADIEEKQDVGITDPSSTVQPSVSSHIIDNETVEGKQVLAEIDIQVSDTDAATDCKGTLPRLNPELAGFGWVQDWVDSLEHKDCCNTSPTPLMGESVGHEQNHTVQNDNLIGTAVARAPLHEHFGYESARDLFNKKLSAHDEEKLSSQKISSPGISHAAAVASEPPTSSAGRQPTSPTPAEQPEKGRRKDRDGAEQGSQAVGASNPKAGLKGFGGRRSLSAARNRSKVVVNGHALSEIAIKRAEERAGKLQPGNYWYDGRAGFWGIVGGPCLGVIPPFIEELHHPMDKTCSNGDTQVLVNGRELHHKDIAILSLRGLSKKPGRAYVICYDGVVTDEASGHELAHLGKLAPTVERRGKGFGMFMIKQR